MASSRGKNIGGRECVGPLPLPPVVLAALLYGIAGRPWLAYVLTALPVLGLSFGNYYKLAFRDDPVIAKASFTL